MSKASEVLGSMEEVSSAAKVLKAVENGIRNWTEIDDYKVYGDELHLVLKDKSRFVIAVSKATR